MRLLIVGNIDKQYNLASTIAKERGASVRQVSSIEAALNLLRNGQSADLIMIDVKHDIASLIAQMSSEHICVPVIACGIENSAEEAVNAIKAGAKEFIKLPPDEQLIAALFESITSEPETLTMKSKEMHSVFKLVDKIASSDASVLVTGESGTGKEVISRYIHLKSKRSQKPFISINCAAIPENLIESELFGHEKGAFTGAIARRIGKFEEANNGTLLLDEISEIDIRLQAKLLRAIQEKEVDRIGGSKPIKLNLRVIATSNRDLKLEVQEGRFREDLFFRLNIINIKLPPLRDRKEDIIILAEYFIKKYSEVNNIIPKSLSNDAIAKLKQYSWPGNIRELENTMHRAVLLSENSQIEVNDLMIGEFEPQNSAQSKQSTLSDLVGRTVESVEKELILSTINHCLGNRTHAARVLGISIKTLRNKLDNYVNSKALHEENIE